MKEENIANFDEPKETYSKFKIGLTIALGVLIFVFFVVIVGMGSNLFSSTFEIKIFADNVEGLTLNSPVMLGGMKIGSVKQMDYYNTGKKNGIDITLELLTKYRPLITANSSASIKTLGLLGDKFVDISLGMQDESPIKEGDYIRLQKSMSMEGIANNMDKTLKDLGAAVSNIKSITDTISSGKGSAGRLIYSSVAADKIEAAASSISEITESIERRQGTLGKLVYDDRLYNDLASLSSNLNGITENIKNGKGTLGKLAANDSLYNNLTMTASSLNSLLQKAGSPDGTIGKMVNDKEFYETMKRLLENLDKLATDINEHPDKYINVSVF
jgi:phospholipid/cholesterol/gamma-HCH transport system substrate-binding protein